MTPINQNLRCNEQIRISPVRLIGPNNEQIGVVPTFEAMRMAQEAGMDLVEVAPNVRPPVCRVMDYGKWKYYQKKHQKHHREQELKEVRLRPKTDTHDLKIKVLRAIEFLNKGDKVQFTMVFKGRERAHREIGTEQFQHIITELGEAAKVERPPSMDGKNMVMILAPGKLVPEKPAAPRTEGDNMPPVPAPQAAVSAAAVAAPAAASPVNAPHSESE